MKPIIFLFLLIFIKQASVHAQQLDCDSLAREYYGVDDPRIYKEPFCKGVEQALETDGLVLRSLGDPDHLYPCQYYAYSFYGVKLELTGDIVISGQEIENQGFNAVMIPRIKDSLGADYEQLGMIDSSWHLLSEKELWRTLDSVFYDIPNHSDTSIHLFIDSIALQKSVFQNFNGIVFQTIQGDTIELRAFYKGVDIPKLLSERIYLKMDLSNYENKNHTCLPPWTWIMPYPLVTYH